MSITSVSAHIFVYTKDKRQCSHALLQRRGFHNFEKDGKPESWQYGLQPAAHGKIDSENSAAEQMDVELREELGDEFYGNLPMSEQQKPLLIASTAHFCFICEHNELKKIRLHPSSGGLLLITPEQFKSIQDLRKFPKDQPIPIDVMAMFPDDKEAMIRLWEKVTA